MFTSHFYLIFYEVYMSLPISILVVGFFLLISNGPLYINENNLWSTICIATYLFSSLLCVFGFFFFLFSFMQNFVEQNSSIIHFGIWIFGYIQECFPCYKIITFPSVFSILEPLWFHILHFNLWLIWNAFCVGNDLGIEHRLFSQMIIQFSRYHFTHLQFFKKKKNKNSLECMLFLNSDSRIWVGLVGR